MHELFDLHNVQRIVVCDLHPFHVKEGCLSYPRYL